jgi:ankyrin repeat protein
VEAGADVNARIFYGLSPLMLAAGAGEAAVCEVLLEAGADVKAANDGGRTALAMAKERFFVDVINLLHEAEGFVMETEGGGSCSSSRKGPPSEAKVVNFMKRPMH